ncbi:unnamed protein product [Closterium sp. NIES-53]
MPCPAAALSRPCTDAAKLRPCPAELRRPAKPRRPTEPRRPAEPRRPTEPHCPARAAPAATAVSAATAATTALASPTVLTFDAEGRAVDFDVWVVDLQLFFQCDSKDGVSLFDHMSGVSPAPAATADSTVRSQWTTRDVVARLAVRSHLPSSECYMMLSFAFTSVCLPSYVRVLHAWCESVQEFVFGVVWIL